MAIDEEKEIVMVGWCGPKTTTIYFSAVFNNLSPEQTKAFNGSHCCYNLNVKATF